MAQMPQTSQSESALLLYTELIADLMSRSVTVELFYKLFHDRLKMFREVKRVAVCFFSFFLYLFFLIRLMNT